MRLRDCGRELSEHRCRVPATSCRVLVPHQHQGFALKGLGQETYTLPPMVNNHAHAAVAYADYRLGVILAADTVAYTRRMAEDEARMHTSCMAVYRDIVVPGIVYHGARIIKHTGDGFLAEFASATRAVWFAVVFQDAMRDWNAREGLRQPLRFRIGINLGDVYVEQHDVFGHNVNIAARMQESARPGGVLISHAVAASVRDTRLQFEDAGDLALRHIDKPVRAFHVRLSRQRKRKACVSTEPGLTQASVIGSHDLCVV
jgi:class 3 adenylate cyclase